MNITCGVDIVHIPRFTKTLSQNKKHFTTNIFTSDEFRNPGPEHLAGVFAAKEATAKALGIPAGKWNEITIMNRTNGKPEISHLPDGTPPASCDLSISHDGDYAVAFAVCTTPSARTAR